MPAAGQEGGAAGRGDGNLSGVRRADEAAAEPRGGYFLGCAQVSQVQGHARGVAGAARTVPEAADWGDLEVALPHGRDIRPFARGNAFGFNEVGS